MKISYITSNEQWALDSWTSKKVKLKGGRFVVRWNKPGWFIWSAKWLTEKFECWFSLTIWCKPSLWPCLRLISTSFIFLGKFIKRLQYLTKIWKKYSNFFFLVSLLLPRCRIEPSLRFFHGFFRPFVVICIQFIWVVLVLLLNGTHCTFFGPGVIIGLATSVSSSFPFCARRYFFFF